ncbi:hypothetical protein HQ529_05620 [Candidatus Woesearchaeota archaeon]|nr:hypothetical protein [Candidatus Woesearchaeota archaeon]
MKKAQGISLNVIIIAAIALLVLVILSVIFMGRMGTFGTESAACENKGGMCGDVCGEVDSNVEAYPTPYSAWTCDEEQVCCIAVSP